MTQPAAFFMSAVPAFSILGGKLRWILRAGGIQGRLRHMQHIGRLRHILLAGYS